jgi:NAD(P)-dependent dehydrogenase (short-subunit alcohol dehydrogenase family)
MQAFLEVQRSTMLAYLAGRGAAAPTEGSARHDVSSVGEASGPPRSERAAPSSQISNGNGSVVDGYVPSHEHKKSDSNGRHHESNGTHGIQNGKVPDAHAEKSSAGAPDRAEIAARLLETVRDRTGYPIETLGLDLDMEADLGIDSIKRVEILGKLRDEFPGFKALSDTPEMMDAMARARTLGVIVERMSSLAQPPGGPATASGKLHTRALDMVGTNGSANGNGKHESATQRRLLEVVDAPLPCETSRLMAGGRIVITDDTRGLARILERHLQEIGTPAERLGGPDEPVDWTSPSSIDQALERLRSRGPLAGIVHALPLGSATPVERIEADWSARVGVEVRGLFLTAKAMAADLENAARAGGACLIAATALGGRFASAGSQATGFFPGHGGVAGLVKTLAREWPSIRSRVVDFSSDLSMETIAAQLAAEVFAGDGWAEVGYDQGRRIRLRTVASPLHHGGSTLELKPGDPVLITGGARGITALAAAELARLWRPTLLLVGTTPLPGDGEPADTLGMSAEADIKAALLARLRRDGRPCSPAEIEKHYLALRRGREVRENLESLRQTGATVEYAQADVRDQGALARVLDGWRARHGEIVGLIHGAGLIKDKLIRQKSVESFDRVLETKLDGALNLIRLLRGDALKFTALYSSIAGRFGNVGQSDYAAANEILNKLAHWLDRRWPGRVVSLVWGPWSGVGMVAELESHLDRRGLGMISSAAGGSLLIDELRHGRKGDVEVIYSGKLGTLEQPIVFAAAPEWAEAFS